jgi:hypothetical protein
LADIKSQAAAEFDRRIAETKAMRTQAAKASIPRVQSGNMPFGGGAITIEDANAAAGQRLLIAKCDQQVERLYKLKKSLADPLWLPQTLPTDWNPGSIGMICNIDVVQAETKKLAMGRADGIGEFADVAIKGDVPSTLVAGKPAKLDRFVVVIDSKDIELPSGDHGTLRIVEILDLKKFLVAEDVATPDKNSGHAYAVPIPVPDPE